MTEEKAAENREIVAAKPTEAGHAHHHHHTWLGKHFCARNFKRLGALGVILFVLHILFHVVEILLIPTILLWLGL